MGYKWIIWAVLFSTLPKEEKEPEKPILLIRIFSFIWRFIITVLLISGIIETIIWLSSKYS